MKTIIVTIDGTEYRFVYAEVTATIARKVRAATGVSLFTVLGMVTGDVDIDILAAVCYAAELQAGGSKTLADIEVSIDYQSEVTVEFGDDPEA